MCFFCLPFLLICSRCVREVLGASIQLTCDVSPAAHGTLANCAPKGVSNERFQNPQNDVFLQDLLFQTRFGGKSLVRSLFFLIYWGYRWKDVLRKKPGGSCIPVTLSGFLDTLDQLPQHHLEIPHQDMSILDTSHFPLNRDCWGRSRNQSNYNSQ